MRSNFICIRFIGIVFDAVWLQRLCFFLSDFFDFGRFQKIFSFSKKIIIKTNLLCCPAPFLQYRFCGSASQTLFILLFLFVSSAMFLLPRFSCSVFQSAKSLKKCSKNFYGLAKSVSRPYPYHICSNFIQSYSKNQDSICFFSRLLLLLVLLLKRAALLKVEPPVLY